jgi:site-specific DNA recombinase
MSPESNLVLDAYIRVSQVAGREGESFISPDVQRQQIAAWAKLRGVRIAAEHVDLDQTGGKLQRPGLDALMDRVRNGQTGGIAVARLDRLSRASVAEALKLVEEINGHGGKIAAVDLGIDPTTTFGEFALTIMLALARMERRRITESWDVAAERAIARGIHFTNSVPLGYVRGEDKRLQIDPEAAPIVSELFRRRAQRQSYHQLARWLNDECPRKDGRRWTSRNVAVMLGMQTYLGIAHHGPHRNENAHPAIVTLPEFRAVQAVNGGTGAIKRESALLSGIIRCAGCRYAMRHVWQKYTLASGEVKRVGTYACQRRHAGGVCQEPAHVMAHTVEPVVIEHFLMWHGLEDGWERPGAPDELQEAERQLADAQARLEAFLADDELRETVGRDAFLAEAKRRQQAIANAEAARDALAAQGHTDDVRLFFLRDEWETFDKAERAQRLRSAIESVYVRRGHAQRDRLDAPIQDRVLIRWAGEDRSERPRRGTTDYKSQPILWPPETVSAHLYNIPEWAVRQGHPLLDEDLREDIIAAAREDGIASWYTPEGHASSHSNGPQLSREAFEARLREATGLPEESSDPPPAHP